MEFGRCNRDGEPARLGAPTDRELLFVLGGLAALGSLSTNIILPSLPTMAGTFGVSTPTLGVAQSTFLVAFAVGQLFVGPLSDRFGRRAFAVGGLVVFVAGHEQSNTARPASNTATRRWSTVTA
jgi:DHA1 family bicyclomycin/chloramphenicol resistance-like MFS transporter